MLSARLPRITHSLSSSSFYACRRGVFVSSIDVIQGSGIRYVTTTTSDVPLTPSTGKRLTAAEARRGLISAIPLSSEDMPSGANPNDSKNPTPDFTDARSAFESKSTGQLTQGLLSFGLCQIPILVRHAEPLLKVTRKVAGDGITDAILKSTLFGHFCAGEDEKGIQPTIRALEKAGIGSILDFAAEDDGEGTKPQNEVPTGDFQADVAEEITQDHIHKVRVYDYESEAKCDQHVDTFKQCIRDVASLQSDGYAAIKVTALGNPNLLERMSRAIIEAQNLFAKMDEDGNGLITREEFAKGYSLFFRDDDVELKQILDEMTAEKGMVDYITWSMSLSPKDLPRITSGCREVGPLAMAAPTEEEVELIEKMYARGHALAKEAAVNGTRLLIDAEQARFQPAIDNLVLDLQRTYNATDVTDVPIIYNTYQCYLKDVDVRLPTDVERSERFDYHFGAKLVRGAYMESERELAAQLGYPSPIHETKEDTHKCYNNAVRFLLEHATKSDKTVELMLATHNQESIEKAIAAMNELGIDRSATTICFAQLFGMMDHLTFNMGKHGYRAYKYVPYGPVKMVMPYLIRRANENSSIASGAGKELSMLTRELRRRVFG